MLPDDDRASFQKVATALHAQFKSVDIKELRGLEFHHKVQGDETIEVLGLKLQSLGRKAFPSSQGCEFDRLLKGRFFQALHVKWQRKLGAPKTGETFLELYDRARVLQQLQELAASCNNGAKRNGDRTQQSKEGGDKAQQPRDSGDLRQRPRPQGKQCVCLVQATD